MMYEAPANIDIVVKITGAYPRSAEGQKKELLWEFFTTRNHLLENKYMLKRIAWIASRYHYFNPKYKEVNYQYFTVENERTELELLIRRRTTCKRMVTKVQNGINKYIEHENKKLLPYLDNPLLARAKEKLKRYQDELDQIEAKIVGLQ